MAGSASELKRELTFSHDKSPTRKTTVCLNNFQVYREPGGTFQVLVKSVTKESEYVGGVTVVGVGQLKGSFSCISCKKSVLLPRTTVKEQCVAECTTCGTKQKVRDLKTTAKLYLEDTSGTSLCLRAHPEALTQIVESNDVTSDSLLQSEPFNVTYNTFNVITFVS